jgi:thymidylate synthase (FAD)
MRVHLLSHNQSKKITKFLKKEEVPPHLSFTFAIEGISRSCSHQLVRHRVASFSQQSQRYILIELLIDQVVIPDSIKEKASELFDGFIKETQKIYQRLVEMEIPKEDARFVLPNATETNLLLTMTGGSLIHFFGLRCCERAQWEIRDLADKMLKEVRRVEPELFKDVGPYCLQLGYCPEGKFSCGKIDEIVSKYSVW